ncbi:MAG: glycosyltransferase family 2 protein, partial [bacterium]|nr:glycosyltransferase family 2 protein [bacterium]
MTTYAHKRNYTTEAVLAGMKSSQGFFLNCVLAIFLIIALTTIIWIKSKNIGAFSDDYFLIAYTIFLTGFQLMRITSALFYKSSFKRITTELTTKVQNAKYEPKVTCVIPCMNEEGAIDTTIRQCYAADYPRKKLEVIVINDGSTDRTGEIIDELKRTEFPDMRIVHWKKNKGKREGMNAGFRLATGEIIIQLDSDSYIVPHTFKKIIEPFKNPAIGAVCAHADPQNADQNWISKMQAAYYFMAFRILKAAESTFGLVFCCSGCSSAYRRSIVMPLLKPWLAEVFMGKKVTWGDDRALTSHVIKAGFKTVYTDEARAVTIVP